MKSFALSLLLFAGSACASEWQEFATAKDGTVYSIDLSRMTDLGGARARVWGKTDVRGMTVNRPNYAHRIDLLDIDCAAKTYAFQAKFVYDETGNVTASDAKPGPPLPAAPDSISETMIDLVCKRFGKAR